MYDFLKTNLFTKNYYKILYVLQYLIRSDESKCKALTGDALGVKAIKRNMNMQAKVKYNAD